MAVSDTVSGVLLPFLTYKSQPPYFFKIEEIKPNPGCTPESTPEGHWRPSTYPNYNYRTGDGVSNILWKCQGTYISQASMQITPTLEVYKQYSVFYSEGFGFWVLSGDATDPSGEQAWNALRFDHGHVNGAAYLTQAGQESAIPLQHPSAMWHHKLLPNTYHGSRPQPPGCGGLVGELPIFLALVAMSMDPTDLLQYIPWMFQNDAWLVHSLVRGRKYAPVERLE